MGRLRFYTALIFARIIYLAIKLLNKSSGTSFAGMAVLKICPDFLTFCKKYITKAITVTGTNGKTTTSGLLAHILETNNNSVVHNLKGANMLTGIANAFALNILPFKKFDYAVIESDEAYLTKLYDYFKSDFLLITNLFRDQLDRYGELSTTAGFIQKAIDKNPRLTLLLNADDPLVTNFGKNSVNVRYYGFEEVEFCSEIHNILSNAPTEVFNCVCSNPLKYTRRFFAQQGHYHCDICGYKRPEPDFKGYVKIYADYSELKVINVRENKTFEVHINLTGLYNAYNALAAVSNALMLGIDYEIIKNALSSYRSIFGRTETRFIKGRKALIQLIKNPTGASEVLKTVDLASDIVIAINDNYADGRDISWLWDSDFERLRDAQNPIITTGTRAYDMGLRLKYAGVAQDRIIVMEDIKSAIEFAVKSGRMEERITILPTYTALLKISKMKF